MEHREKRAYSSPAAEVVLFTPKEKLASWTLGKGTGWWKGDSIIWWGEKAADTASLVTGTIALPDEDGTSWEIPKN